MLAAEINSGLEEVPAADVGQVVDILIVRLVAVYGELPGATHGSGRVGRRVGDSNDGRVVSRGDVHQGGAQAQAEAELAPGGAGEHVRSREADVLLLVVLKGGLAPDQGQRLAALPAVLVAQREGVSVGGVVVELAAVILIGIVGGLGFRIAVVAGRQVVRRHSGKAIEDAFEESSVGLEVGMLFRFQTQAAVPDL